MKMNRIIALVAFCLACSLTYSQTRVTVSGVVSDSHGETLVGVSIYENRIPAKGS